MAVLAEQPQQALVVDVEAEGAGGRVEIGAVDENADTLARDKIVISSGSSQ